MNDPSKKFSEQLAELERLTNSLMAKSSKPKRSIAVLMKKSEPLAKAATHPHFVWHGHSPQVNLSPGVVIEGWKP